MAMIRTFIAIEIPVELKQEVDRLIIQLKSAGPEVKWVRAANLHFTVRFLGDISETDIPDLVEAIKKQVENLKSFEINLSGLGCFPNMNRPRIVWLGADGDLNALKETAYKVESACREAGYGKSDKPFSAHLTIGRIKNPRGLETLISKLPDIQFNSDEFKISELTIFKSDLSPRGPKYTKIATITLSE